MSNSPIKASILVQTLYFPELFSHSTSIRLFLTMLHVKGLSAIMVMKATAMEAFYCVTVSVQLIFAFCLPVILFRLRFT